MTAFLNQVAAREYDDAICHFRCASRDLDLQLQLGVTGLDAILARLAAHGIDHEPVETYSNGVRHVVVLDPDRNSLSLAKAPAQ